MVRNTYEVQNIGDLLREKRKQLGQDIKQVSEHTKIRSEYLLALESGNYEKFASDVYAKGFLKKYAKYLGISPDRAAAMYRRESPANDKDIFREIGLNSNLGNKGFELNSTKIITGIILLILAGFVFYLISQISVVLKSPQLHLTAPVTAEAGSQASYTTVASKITLSGNVEIGSSLTFNNSPVTVNNLQIFEIADVNLNQGENRFLLTAKSQFGQESKINLVVIRNPDSGNNQPTTTPPTNSNILINAQLSIQKRDTYVQVQSDNQTPFAQVLTIGSTKTFTANTSLIFSTAHPEDVTLVINGTNYPIINTRQYKFTIDSSGNVKQLNV